MTPSDLAAFSRLILAVALLSVCLGACLWALWGTVLASGLLSVFGRLLNPLHAWLLRRARVECPHCGGDGVDWQAMKERQARRARR